MINKTERTRKPLKKAALKSIIALVLCMATIIGSIGAGANTASAAKKYNLVMKFNGKSVTLIKDIHSKKSTYITLNKLKKNLGNPKKKTWKKGKTSIGYFVQDDGLVLLEIGISDKNGSMAGVKVGMKKSTAIKKLKENLGLKKINIEKQESDEYAYLEFGTRYTVTFENGKVSSIYFFTGLDKK